MRSWWVSPFAADRSSFLGLVHPFQVGLMDIDICGPSLPHLLGLQNETLHTSSSGWSPIYVTPNLACISIGFLLPSSSAAIIWRGPKKNQLIKQFLKDVDWGDEGLDYLVVDTPPGTSDEHLSVVQYLKEGGIDGAVLVTTPQEVSLQDVRKELDFCRKVGVKVLGVVENMSGFVCPSCNGKSDVFFPSTGGAKALAEEGTSFLSLSLSVFCIRFLGLQESIFKNFHHSSIHPTILLLCQPVSCFQPASRSSAPSHWILGLASHATWACRSSRNTPIVQPPRNTLKSSRVRPLGFPFPPSSTTKSSWPLS